VGEPARGGSAPPPGLLAALVRPGPRGRYAANALAGQIVFAAITFAGGVLAARLFGADGKGTLTSWTLVSGLGGLVLAGPVATGLARALLDGELHRLATVTMRHAAIALAGLVVIAGPAIALGLDPLAVVCFLVVGVSAAVVVEDVATVMVAAKRPWAYARLRIVRSLVFAGGLGVVAVAGGSIDVAFVLWAAGSLASVALAMRAAQPYAGKAPIGLARAWRLGRGSAVTRISTWAIRRLDQFVVAAIAGIPALGLYSAAVNLSEVTEYAGTAIGQASFESERTLDDAAAKRIMRMSAVLLGAISVAVTVAGFFLIGPIFGDEFTEARWVLVLLAPGLVLRGPAIAGGQMMLARGQGRLLSRFMVASVLFGLVVWSAATLAWGINGAAFASSLVYVLQAALIRGGVLAGERDEDGWTNWVRRHAIRG
jgi:O-antigen/teichoic acid export membrane protein